MPTQQVTIEAVKLIISNKDSIHFEGIVRMCLKDYHEHVLSLATEKIKQEFKLISIAENGIKIYAYSPLTS